MMIKILLSLVLSFGLVAETVAEPLAQDIEHKNKSVVLKDLDFKTVMMAFYQKEIQYRKIEQLDHEKVQYVGIKEALNTGINDNDVAVIVFSPAQVFRNAQNELRYILTTTEVAVDEDGHDLKFCGVCATYTQLYLFKKNALGQFELLSKSQDSDGWINGEFTYMPYPTENIRANIRKVGSKIKGYVEEYEYGRQGYSQTTFYITPLDENPIIVKLKVAEIGNNNETTVNQEVYNTQGDYRFLTTEHDGLYDIEIRYSGTKQVDVGDTAKIVPVKETQIYHYNEKQQKYVRVK